MTRIRVLVVAAAIVGLGVACEPPPTPISLTVTTTASGDDHTPGDGVCEMTPGSGDCSLEAAVQEGNAAPRAAITVPAGTYQARELTVTGDLSWNWGRPEEVVLGDVLVTVAPGGHLSAEGLRPTDAPSDAPAFAPVRFVVAGHLQLRRSVLFGLTSEVDGRPLEIEPGGRAAVEDSVLVGGAAAITNGGTLLSERSTLVTVVTPRLVTEAGATSHLRATMFGVLATTRFPYPDCQGPVVLHGYDAVAAEPRVHGCGPLGPTDVTFPNVVSEVPPPPTGALVDAIPVGTAGCSLSATDVDGRPRGVDGNGDGVAGCDIGAIELQP